MRRLKLFILVIVATLFPAAPAFGQSPCDDGVFVSYSFVASSGGYRITEAIVSGIHSNCEGADLTVTLRNGGVDQASGSAIISGDTVTVAMDPQPPAAEVDEVAVTIEGEEVDADPSPSPSPDPGSPAPSPAQLTSDRGAPPPGQVTPRTGLWFLLGLAGGLLLITSGSAMLRLRRRTRR